MSVLLLTLEDTLINLSEPPFLSPVTPLTHTRSIIVAVMSGWLTTHKAARAALAPSDQVRNVGH